MLRSLAEAKTMTAACLMIVGVSDVQDALESHSAQSGTLLSSCAGCIDPCISMRTSTFYIDASIEIYRYYPFTGFSMQCLLWRFGCPWYPWTFHWLVHTEDLAMGLILRGSNKQGPSSSLDLGIHWLQLCLLLDVGCWLWLLLVCDLLFHSQQESLYPQANSNCSIKHAGEFYLLALGCCFLAWFQQRFLQCTILHSSYHHCVIGLGFLTICSVLIAVNDTRLLVLLVMIAPHVWCYIVLCSQGYRYAPGVTQQLLELLLFVITQYYCLYLLSHDSHHHETFYSNH